MGIMPINSNSRKNEADKPKVKEIQDGDFIKRHNDVRVIRELDSGVCCTIDLSDLSIRYYVNMQELKKRLSAWGSEVEIIRPGQANDHISFEW
ncbi:hypothetical protein BSP21_122 [Bacillus phage BSP21]|nr:hypothetical protein BSP21_122 [Bacillus phage BSP21]